MFLMIKHWEKCYEKISTSVAVVFVFGQSICRLLGDNYKNTYDYKRTWA
ncbi:hypothetical protein ALP76_102117 [Pseudomonas savastanoi pv. glycinea]|uniref:Uncharacterized protein n=1 Tax=Pseudomonas savastanoi pv. glycinea TaxID=318 RepID=A0A3M4JVW0_PSESG|nr:hypothetical protein ALQ73_102054 [Pseudomonas savastanoi pv. glycinea]RMM88378.1 hypothetical protein ALQ69_103325 [Pseudomonas savastanoi pv. glycinea]RMQ20965.1 hypothetical protein ALQ11_102426 [Pseudomonas savastanoi pv. glycinea]RMR84579.1 hypothetical protein ALP76_102117 [Pseudomonas savastanoi pv. glycinea]